MIRDNREHSQAAACDVDRIRKVLNADWDPIGGCPEDEYDRYAHRAYSMIVNEGADLQELADYLYKSETEAMGLRGGPEAMKRSCAVAATIIALLR